MKILVFCSLLMASFHSLALTKERALNALTELREEIIQPKSIDVDGLTQKESLMVIRYSINKDIQAQLVDLLIFHVDQHYDGKDFREFMLNQLPIMAGAELEDFSSAAISKVNSEIFQTLSNSELNGRPLLTQTIEFIKQLNIKKELPTDKFFATPNYTNNWRGSDAKGLPATDVGEAVEKRLAKLKRLEAQRIRMKIENRK